jgi:single-stranded-DNA-specific exonuclease
VLPEILDFRRGVAIEDLPLLEEVLWVRSGPRSWDELLAKYELARSTGQKLALCYRPPLEQSPIAVLQRLIGLAKFLARTGRAMGRGDLQGRLEVSVGATRDGLDCLEAIGFEVSMFPARDEFAVAGEPDPGLDLAQVSEVQSFLGAIAEDFFIARYFWEVPLSLITTMANQR